MNTALANRLNTERSERLGILEEPMGYVDGTGLYEYVKNDPIGNVDPDGRQTKPTATAPTTSPWDGKVKDETGAPTPFPKFPGDAREDREAFAKEMVLYYNRWAANNNTCCLIDAQTLVAQWMMESNWGRSRLVQSTWNFGNIKGQGPAGSTAANTPEVIGGQQVVVGANFRKYNNPDEFFADYNKLICTNPRYKNAKDKFGEEYFQALKDAGYATDPEYVKKAMQIYNQLGFN